MKQTSFLFASAVLLLSLLGLSACSSGWWKVDDSPYQPPEQSADEQALFAGRAPVGGSSGTGDMPRQGTAKKGEEGDPAFQPRPGK